MSTKVLELAMLIMFLDKFMDEGAKIDSKGKR